jgi:hypothetical protein
MEVNFVQKYKSMEEFTVIFYNPPTEYDNLRYIYICANIKPNIEILLSERLSVRWIYYLTNNKSNFKHKL